MKNKFLSEPTANDIDQHVTKVLRDLGDPPPPLRLDEVRELLRLDLAFYSSTEDGILREIVHKLTVAGKQIVHRPSLLVDVVRKFDLRALFLPDRKRILLDSSQPEIKQRWHEGHEIVHSIVPWHSYLMLGDSHLTLTPSCHDQIEAESNYGTGRLLFLQETFTEMIRDAPPSIKSMQRLNKIFGNTITNTLWQFIERSNKLLLGMVTEHPHYLPAAFDKKDPCKYFIRSKPFAQKFADVTELQLFKIISTYCSRQRGGPLGEGEALLQDVNGVHHVFQFETFYNRHQALTLGIHCGEKPITICIKPT